MSFDRSLLPDPASYYEAEGLKLQGRGKWRTACCPLHGGDSLRVNIESGAFACMAGCDLHGGDVVAFHMQRNGLEFIEAARALGAWKLDGDYRQAKPAPLSPRSALQVLAIESTLTAVAAGNIAHGVILTDDDRARLMVAAGRINRIVEAYQ